MKKFISFLIICIILFTAVSTVYGESNIVNENKYLDIIVSLGLMDSVAADAPVTRAQAAQIAANLLYTGKIPESQNAPYIDVPLDYWAANAVNALKTEGYFDNENMFYPDKEISFNEAVSLIVGILGYKEAEKSGIDVNYITAAGNSGLLTGIQNRKNFTSRDMARIIYNALETPMLVSDYAASGKTYQTDANATLAAAFNIVTVSGTLSATHNAAISGSSAPKGCIRINNDTYYTNLDMDRYISSDITAYARIFGDNEYPTVVYADFPSLEWLEIDADDITGISDSSILYNEYKGENIRKKTAVLEDNAVIVYNGKQVKEFDKSPYIQPSLGSVYLIKSSTSEKYTSAFVLDYDVKVISYASVSQNKIVCAGISGNEVIDVENYEEIEVFRDGKEISLGKLYPNDVIHLCPSADRSLLRIYTSDNAVIGGALGGISEGLAVIDGKKYQTYEDVFETEKYGEISIGDSADYFVDLNGKIFAYRKDELIDKVYYGYVYDMSEGNGFDEPQVKIFNEIGRIQIFNLADKVKVSIGGSTSYFTGKELLSSSYFRTEDGNVNDRLIKYRITENNEIVSIALPKTLSAEEQKQGYSDDFSLVLENDEASGTYMTYDRYNTGRFNNKYIADDNAIVFYIPSNLDEEKMLITTASTALGNITDNASTKSFGYIALYNSDEFLNVDIIVCKTASEMSPNSSSNPAIIKKVAKAVDKNGDVVNKLYYYQDGKENETIVNSDTDSSVFAPGVMAQLYTDANNEITGYRILYNPKTDTEHFVKSINSSTVREGAAAYWHADCFVFFGNVYSRNAEASRMVVNTDLSWDEMRSMNIKSASYYLYDTEKNTVKPASAEDLTAVRSQPCKVAFRSMRSSVRELIIIK